MIDKSFMYEKPRVDVLLILPESVLAGSIEDPVVNPEEAW